MSYVMQSFYQPHLNTPINPTTRLFLFYKNLVKLFLFHKLDLHFYMFGFTSSVLPRSFFLPYEAYFLKTIFSLNYFCKLPILRYSINKLNQIVLYRCLLSVFFYLHNVSINFVGLLFSTHFFHNSYFMITQVIYFPITNKFYREAFLVFFFLLPFN
jgi:hypothetical protein